MKDYVITNDVDDNFHFTVTAANLEDAMYYALRELGFYIREADNTEEDEA